MMLDHITISVNDYAKSKAFYTEALQPLGYRLLIEVEGYAGFGVTADFKGFGSAENEGPIATFWMYQGEKPTSGTHIAFRAMKRNEVDDFYKQALIAGGIDNGAPGIRAHYHPNYYGAFVLDPDGNNIESVC
ncbi:MAG TPA: VOC family protein, partial [Gammaproteobacteria bacterium]|nr:VOC family protein [Gammaproteobacteria bacterium]